MATDESKANNNEDVKYINEKTKTPFPKIVSDDKEWLAARLTLLKAEKEFGKARAALAKQRRAMPVKLVNKDYVFEDSSDGNKVSLSNLFNKDNNNLIVYHLMFDQNWEKPCSSCSFWLDGINGNLPHILPRSQEIKKSQRVERMEFCNVVE